MAIDGNLAAGTGNYGIYWLTDGWGTYGFASLFIFNVNIRQTSGPGIEVHNSVFPVWQPGLVVIENVHVEGSVGGGILLYNSDDEMDNVWIDAYEPNLLLQGGSHIISQLYLEGTHDVTPTLCYCSMYIYSATYVFVQDYIIDASKRNGVMMYGSTNVTFTNGMVSGSSVSYNGIYYDFVLNNTSSVTVSSSKFLESLGGSKTNSIFYANSNSKKIAFIGNQVEGGAFANAPFTVPVNVLGVQLVNNYIYFPSGATVTVNAITILSGANDTLVTGNQIIADSQTVTPTVGIYYNSAGNTIVGNSIRYFFYGIQSGTSGTNTIISSNNIFDSSTGIYINTGHQINIVGNQVTNSASPALNNGIYVISSTNVVVANNVVFGSGSGAGVCVYVANVSTNVTVTGNFANSCQILFREFGTAGYNLFTGNYLGTTRTTKFSTVNNFTQIIGNFGYNPIGTIANFVYAGGTAAGDGNFISPKGTTGTIVASTTYTIANSPCRILVRVVGSTSIAINGGTAFTPGIGDSYYLYPGDTINFGAFGGSPPTLQVDFT